MTPLPQPPRDRAGGRRGCRSWSTARVVGARGGSQVPAGQGHRQLDLSLKEGEEKFLEQARLVRGYGAAVVVMAFDEAGPGDHGRAQGRDLRARVQAARRDGGLRARGHRLRPERPRRGDRDGGAQQLRRSNSSRRWGGSSSECPGAKTSGGVSNVSSLSRQRVVREAMDAAFLYHAIRAGLTWASSTRASCRFTRTIEPATAELVEDVISTAGPMRPSARRARGGRHTRRRRARTRGRSLSWRDAPVEERLEARARQGHRGLHRGGHRGGAAEVRPGRCTSSKAR